MALPSMLEPRSRSDDRGATAEGFPAEPIGALIRYAFQFSGEDTDKRIWMPQGREDASSGAHAAEPAHFLVSTNINHLDLATGMSSALGDFEGRWFCRTTALLRGLSNRVLSSAASGSIAQPHAHPGTAGVRGERHEVSGCRAEVVGG
jgi:hypothetical protein